MIANILSGNYKPGLVQVMDILNNKGKVRTISKLITLDRLILHAIYQVLYARISPRFSPFSFAFRENKSTADAVRQAAKYAEEGFTYTIELYTAG